MGVLVKKVRVPEVCVKAALLTKSPTKLTFLVEAANVFVLIVKSPLIVALEFKFTVAVPAWVRCLNAVVINGISLPVVKATVLLYKISYTPSGVMGAVKVPLVMVIKPPSEMEVLDVLSKAAFLFKVRFERIELIVNGIGATKTPAPPTVKKVGVVAFMFPAVAATPPFKVRSFPLVTSVPLVRVSTPSPLVVRSSV